MSSTTEATHQRRRSSRRHHRHTTLGSQRNQKLRDTTNLTLTTSKNPSSSSTSFDRSVVVVDDNNDHDDGTIAYDDDDDDDDDDIINECSTTKMLLNRLFMSLNDNIPQQQVPATNKRLNLNSNTSINHHHHPTANKRYNNNHNNNNTHNHPNTSNNDNSNNNIPPTSECISHYNTPACTGSSNGGINSRSSSSSTYTSRGSKDRLCSSSNSRSNSSNAGTSNTPSSTSTTTAYHADINKDGFDNMLNWIVTCRALETCYIDRLYFGKMNNHPNKTQQKQMSPLDIITLIQDLLIAISLNTSIQCLKLSNLEIPIELLIQLFKYNHSIREFLMVAGTQPKPNTILISSASTRDTNIVIHELAKAVIMNGSLEALELLHDVEFKCIGPSSPVVVEAVSTSSSSSSSSGGGDGGSGDNTTPTTNNEQQQQQQPLLFDQQQQNNNNMNLSPINCFVIPLLQSLRNLSYYLLDSKLKHLSFQFSYFKIWFEMKSRGNNNHNNNNNNNNNNTRSNNNNTNNVKNWKGKATTKKVTTGSIAHATNGGGSMLEKVRIVLDDSITNSNIHSRILNDILQELNYHTNLKEISITSTSSSSSAASAAGDDVNNHDHGNDDDIHGMMNNPLINNSHNYMDQSCIVDLCCILQSQLSCPESLSLSGFIFDQITFELLCNGISAASFWNNHDTTGNNGVVAVGSTNNTNNHRKCLQELKISYCSFNVDPTTPTIKRFMKTPFELSSLRSLTLEDNTCSSSPVDNNDNENNNNNNNNNNNPNNEDTSLTLIEMLALKILNPTKRIRNKLKPSQYYDHYLNKISTVSSSSATKVSSSLERLRCTGFSKQAMVTILHEISRTVNSKLVLLDFGTILPGSYHENKIDVLCMYIPQLQSLQHIRLNLLGSEKCNDLITSLRKNGSLVNIDLWETISSARRSNRIVIPRHVVPTNGGITTNNNTNNHHSELLRTSSSLSSSNDGGTSNSNQHSTTLQASNSSCIIINNVTRIEDICQRNKLLKKWQTCPSSVSQSLYGHLFESIMELEDNISLIFHQLTSLEM